MMTRIARRQLVANMLRDAGRRGVTIRELLDGGAGNRYGARIFELRELGWQIDAKRERGGAWRYTLVSEPVQRIESIERVHEISLDDEPPPRVDEPEPTAELFGDGERDSGGWPYDPDRDDEPGVIE